ncbi:MAG: periplasmic divalent cation tolerance protein [Verrucomicrobiota bacterium]|jgi:periplasmic divalent cation tolerance protein
MKPAASFAMVFVTAPELKTARRIAAAALRRKLVACANILGAVESHYWWKGKLERGIEVLIILKTRRRLLDDLEKLVVALHPYDTPEILAVPLACGNARYMEWIQSSTRKEPAAKARSPGKRRPIPRVTR